MNAKYIVDKLIAENTPNPSAAELAESEPLTIDFMHDDEQGEREIKLPARWVSCDVCGGTGSTDHPAFANGVDPENFEDEDFAENYRKGAYDVTCRECEGRGEVLYPDTPRCNPADLVCYSEKLKHDADYERERDAERRMGA